ncbi:hypothetical protein [Streptomyces sp. NPDC055632]
MSLPLEEHRPDLPVGINGSSDGKEDGRFKDDPVDGALDVMSRDPEATTGHTPLEPV